MGVKNGSRILTLAVKLHLEENPTHVALKLDKANAYNNLHRRSILAALDGVPELAAYLHFTFFIPFSSSTVPLVFHVEDRSLADLIIK